MNVLLAVDQSLNSSAATKFVKALWLPARSKLKGSPQPEFSRLLSSIRTTLWRWDAKDCQEGSDRTQTNHEVRKRVTQGRSPRTVFSAGCSETGKRDITG